MVAVLFADFGVQQEVDFGMVDELFEFAVGDVDLHDVAVTVEKGGVVAVGRPGDATGWEAGKAFASEDCLDRPGMRGLCGRWRGLRVGGWEGSKKDEREDRSDIWTQEQLLQPEDVRRQALLKGGKSDLDERAFYL